MKEKTNISQDKSIGQEKIIGKGNIETETYLGFMEYLHDMVEMSEKMQQQGHYKNLAKLSATSLAVLMCIPTKGSSNFKEITMKLGLAKSTMTGIISRLESLGYLTQKVSDKDQRVHELSLTKLGRMTQKEHNDYETQVYQIITGNLSDTERKQLLKLLRKGACCGL